MKKLLLCMAFGVFGTGGIPNQALAASQDECAIWLCLPGGFPSGCGAAKSAMKHRLKKGKSPLPSLNACMVKDEYTDPSDFTYTYRRVIHIAEHTKCEVWGGRNDDRCLRTTLVPEHYENGRTCYIGSGDDRRRKQHCLGVYREIKIFEKGKQLGEAYYF